jgi:hypothetical protein
MEKDKSPSVQEAKKIVTIEGPDGKPMEVEVQEGVNFEKLEEGEHVREDSFYQRNVELRESANPFKGRGASDKIGPKGRRVGRR